MWHDTIRPLSLRQLDIRWAFTRRDVDVARRNLNTLLEVGAGLDAVTETGVGEREWATSVMAHGWAKSAGGSLSVHDLVHVWLPPLSTTAEA